MPRPIFFFFLRKTLKPDPAVSTRMSDIPESEPTLKDELTYESAFLLSGACFQTMYDMWVIICMCLMHLIYTGHRPVLVSVHTYEGGFESAGNMNGMRVNQAPQLQMMI